MNNEQLDCLGREDLLLLIRPLLCKAGFCRKPSKAKGFCSGHLAQFQSSGVISQILEKRPKNFMLTYLKDDWQDTPTISKASAMTNQLTRNALYKLQNAGYVEQKYTRYNGTVVALWRLKNDRP